MLLQSDGPTVTRNLNAATQHWNTSYRKQTAEATGRPRLASTRPTWSINRIGYSSSRGTYKTEFTETIGKFGHVPREDLPPTSTKLYNVHNEMSIGT